MQSKRTNCAFNDKHAFWIERTPHALTLYENEAAEGEAKKDDAKTVLAIHFLNDRAVRLFGDFYSPKGVPRRHRPKAASLFGHDRSLSDTGLNGTSVILDPTAESCPNAAFTDAQPAAADDQPLVTAEAADIEDAGRCRRGDDRGGPGVSGLARRPTNWPRPR